MWKQHYENLLNSVTNCHDKAYVMSYFNDICFNDAMVVTAKEVKQYINMLEQGKAQGDDGIAAEHLIYASPILCVILSLCFTSFFTHGKYLAESFMHATICPIMIVKDKSKDLTSADNYRPIAIVTAISKDFEQCVLFRIETLLDNSSLQFGFKNNHSTDMCIFMLKEIVDFYKIHNSPVYLCFMDATKAFDWVNHWTLFRKLIHRKVPMFIIRILQYWYSNQRFFFVRLASAVSNSFGVTVSVKVASSHPNFLMFTQMN